MLSVTRLHVLREVATHGSFSAAAAELAYTQSAVSQQIAALEAEVGTALVERLPRGVRLTPAGSTLVGHAEGILSRLDAAEAEMAAITGLRGGQLRMASFPTAGASLMPLAIAIFRAQHPDVELTLAEGEPDELIDRLVAGEFDLALVFEFPGVGPAVPRSLHRVDLFEDPMHVALPGDHPLAAKPSLRLEDLADVAWVQTSASSACGRHVVRCCHAAGFEPRVAFESDDYATVQGLVAAGVGVALIPELALSGGPPSDVTVRSLTPASPQRRVLAATPRADRRTPAVRAMLEIIGDAAERRDRLGVAA